MRPADGSARAGARLPDATVEDGLGAGGVASSAFDLRRRYYLSMFSCVLFVFSIDMFFLGVSNLLSTVMVVSMVAFEAFLFVFVNWLGSRVIFRPIEDFMNRQRAFDEVVERRIRKLPVLSCAWIASLGAVYALYTFAGTLYAYPELLPTVPLKLYGLLGGLFFYCGFTNLYIFFLITNYVMSLKLHISQLAGVQFGIGRGRIWRKLAVIYLAVLPVYAMILVDMYFSGSLRDLRGHVLVLTDMVFGTVIAFTVIYLVTNGFTRPIDYLLGAYQELSKGNFSVRAPVMSNDEVGVLSDNFNLMAEGLQEREIIRDTLGKYVEPSVADEILKHDVNLAGELRLATILFTDIENYTGLTEDMDPQDVVSMLNEYFSLLVETVGQHRGIVNKFIGDSVFAIFNAPLLDEDHAQNAVRAALEMQRLAGQGRFGRNRVSLGTRIGINTGTIVVGSIGSPDRLEYTAIGDEVNVASRLEQLNKTYGTRILVGEKTFEMAKREFAFERVGEVELKGKSRPTAIYRLQAEAR